MNFYYFLAVLAVFFWSFNVIIADVLVNALTPWQISFFRWIIATILILPFTIKYIIHNRQEILKNKSLILWSAFWGITISNTCVYYAGQTVRPITLSLIGATGPLFLLFWAWLIKNQRLNRIQFMGLSCTLVGVLWVVLFARSDKLGDIGWRIGDLWMLGTAVTFGFYSFLASQKPKELHQFSFLSLCLFWGTVFCVPMFVWDCFSNPLSFHTNLTLKVVLILLFLGIFSSTLAYLCWNRALEKSDIFKVGLTYYLMPVFSTLESWILLDEKISFLQLIGAFIIMAGIVLSNWKTKNVDSSA
ncbi:MAG: DMT family transporter [Alphaproteobacteria bacterium]|nr:DMT family transporter [Alphaproteobacteria bacterium]